jgi:hypothetical protein
MISIALGSHLHARSEGWGGTAPYSSTTQNQNRLSGGICVLTTTESNEAYAPLGLHAVLNAAACERTDITEGRVGIPVTLALQLVDYENRCTVLSGVEVGIWHCDAQGRYADTEVGETFLRGVQYTNHAGCVTFKTILPGSDPMQPARIYLQVVLPSSVPSSRTVCTASGQLRFPQTASIAAYSHPTLYRTGLHCNGATEPAWAADSHSEILTICGDVHTGYLASCVVGIAHAYTHTAAPGHHPQRSTQTHLSA